MINIYDWGDLNNAEKNSLLSRPNTNNKTIESQVAAIIAQVKSDKDQALLEFTQKYDGAKLTKLAVSAAEYALAEEVVTNEQLTAIKIAIDRIKNYQQQCYPQDTTVDTQDGIVCRKLALPIESVGLYVPGGSAPLLSTLMMLAIPAQLAGCKEIILCTPPNSNGDINPLLLATAKLCGIKNIFKVGGAQAVAAMAYGTESIPKVNKIYGPGNSWVTCAKQQVAQDRFGAAIDMPAGPSEVLVIADKTANPNFVAADLLSQAEHGPDSQVI